MTILERSCSTIDRQCHRLRNFGFVASRAVGASLLLSILLAACVEKEVSIKLPNLEGSPLAVLAVVDNGRPPSVLLSRVERLNDRPVSYPVIQAIVVLYEDDLPIDTLKNLVNYIQQIDPLENSIYYSDNVLKLRDGSRYHLTVKAQGFDTAISEHIVYHQLIASDVRLDKSVTDSTEFGPIGDISLMFKTLRAGVVA